MAIGESFEHRARHAAEGYLCLLRTEAALRQFVLEELTIIAGTRWHKARLPSDVRTKLFEGPKYERKFKWFEFIPHNPICYLDFPDLTKIITRADNWDDCFKHFFGNKEGLQSKYHDVELLRNKIAHSRLITERELERLRAFELVVSTSLGQGRYAALLENYLPYGDIGDQLRQIATFFSAVASDVRSAKFITVPPEIKSLLDSWWLDPSYIELDQATLSGALELLELYTGLRREPRDGYKIEVWLRAHPLPEALEKVAAEMLELAKEA